MYQLNQILENKFINKLISDYKRSPNQLNKPHESDAEIIQLGNLKLAITTDSISEEISTGLYDDPYLIGWMIVTVNISDLAAVGATPIGILISEIISNDFSDEKLQLIQKGISDACQEYNTFVLGGDTNEGENLVLTGTAIGLCFQNKFLSRIGSKKGDILYSTGEFGLGNVYAISKLITHSKNEIVYKPIAQLANLDLITKYASSCMDTSDGLIASLDQLMRLNKVGFQLCRDWQKSVDRNAYRFSEEIDIPAWLLFAGQHGEFELVFTIPEELNKSFIDEAFEYEFYPIELGKVVSEEKIFLPLYNGTVQLDTVFLRNLPFETKGDVNHYLKLLLEYDSGIKKSSL